MFKKIALLLVLTTTTAGCAVVPVDYYNTNGTVVYTSPVVHYNPYIYRSPLLNRYYYRPYRPYHYYR